MKQDPRLKEYMEEHFCFDSLKEIGELRPGGGFHIDTGPPTCFACPVCTCAQDATQHAAFRRSPECALVRCKGCKCRLQLHYPPFGPGQLTVHEL